MTRRPSREERHYANLAVALAANDATEPNRPAFAPDAHSRYLAVGGAHVVVALDESERYCVTCEACGQVPNIGSFSPMLPVRHAQRHAETCRRIPERLWPTAGA